MALQKRRRGRHNVGNRRSSWLRRAGKKPLVQACPDCGEPRIPHRVCMSCGSYGGEKIIEVARAEETAE
jgi:large subunit ribosomal protein L32